MREIKVKCGADRKRAIGSLTVAGETVRVRRMEFVGVDAVTQAILDGTNPVKAVRTLIAGRAKYHRSFDLIDLPLETEFWCPTHDTSTLTAEQANEELAHERGDGYTGHRGEGRAPERQEREKLAFGRKSRLTDYSPG